MNNFWEKIKRPFFVMAPMAGYTDQAFRLMCKQYGADVLFSEMVSSEALWHNRENAKCKIKNAKLKMQNTKYAIKNTKLKIQNVQSSLNSKQLCKTLDLIQFSKAERPYVVQIFGSDSSHMAWAAEYIAEGEWFREFSEIRNPKLEIRNKLKFVNSNYLNNFKFQDSDLKLESIPDGLDINMGCPARDVVKNNSGAALMKDPKLAVKIVRNIKKRVKNIPISVKTRLGWSREDEILYFSKALESVGIDALSIHGRTYKQGFAGKVNWQMIERVKKQLSIPVIGNGAIDFDAKIETQNSKLDGYMIGTSALGKPWIFQKLKANKAKENTEFIRKNILTHAALVNEAKGDWGIVEFRKHLMFYTKGLKDSKELRSKLVKVNNFGDIRKIVQKYL